jgi:hypothetical protein
MATKTLDNLFLDTLKTSQMMPTDASPTIGSQPKRIPARSSASSPAANICSLPELCREDKVRVHPTRRERLCTVFLTRPFGHDEYIRKGRLRRYRIDQRDG